MNKTLKGLITMAMVAVGLFFLANGLQSPGYDSFGRFCRPYAGELYCHIPIFVGLGFTFLVSAWIFYRRVRKFWPPRR